MTTSGLQPTYPFSLFPREAKHTHTHTHITITTKKTVLKLYDYLHNSILHKKNAHLIQKGNGLVGVSASKEDKEIHNEEGSQTE